MELRKILIEVLNEGIEGCLEPNEYALGKIEVALTQIKAWAREMVGEMEEVHPRCACDGYNQAKQEIRERIANA